MCKRVIRIDEEIETELQKIYLAYCNLLIVQDLWQLLYQILSIIFLKEFIEFNENLDMIIKNVKHVELSMGIAAVFLNVVRMFVL